MRKLIFCTVLSLSVLCSSCLGSFNAVSGLKAWNDDVSDSKFVNNALFWGLNIIPVYGLFVLGDALIFNVIEFWSGANPIAMEEGDQETQIVKRDGNTYKMVASLNQMEITAIKGPKKGNTLRLEYTPEDASWSAIKPDGERIKLASFEDGFYMVYLPSGPIKIDALESQSEGLTLIQEKVVCHSLEGLMAEVN
ncbi:DUF3332 domain-containing protein [Arenibacter sp. GZD96]|uniref:DUF3332 domain-containing protein n=1 Tax=Aurantibrevibacter litoralis TaxID=3106030 RepID=UPI002AFE10C3|nr:DUF3332 domain-containing protein [Arenibacter sp. GZD-96]MEA1786574.1 DUF3332 domain-containing protein [Arenibacter sp. GZD-96]